MTTLEVEAKFSQCQISNLLEFLLRGNILVVSPYVLDQSCDLKSQIPVVGTPS